MIIGVIKSINANNTSGTVQPDNYDTTFSFSDNNFPNTGLQVGDECKFDLPCFDPDCIATNLKSINTNQTSISTEVNNDQNVGQDEILVIKPGGVVNGNISISGGIVKINGGIVNGDVNSINGGSLVIKNNNSTIGSMTGNYTGNNSMLRIKDGKLVGNATCNNGSVGKVRIGGELTGGITIQNKSRAKLKNGGVHNGNVDIIDSDCNYSKEIGGELTGGITIKNNSSKVKVTP